MYIFFAFTYCCDRNESKRHCSFYCFRYEKKLKTGIAFKSFLSQVSKNISCKTFNFQIIKAVKVEKSFEKLIWSITEIFCIASRDAPVQSDWVPVRLRIQSDWMPVRLGTRSDGLVNVKHEETSARPCWCDFGSQKNPFNLTLTLTKPHPHLSSPSPSFSLRTLISTVVLKFPRAYLSGSPVRLGPSWPVTTGTGASLIARRIH
jgi:hypothetical protein